MAEIDWARVQAHFGISDADLEKAKKSPHLVKLMKAAPRIVRTRLVGEVVSVQYCAHGLKAGQRYVMTCHGNILTDQCTAPLCAYLIAPLAILLPRVVHDRICEGLDPNGMVWDHVRCLDTGFQCGGLGEVSMKVWAEQIPEKAR